MDATRGRCGWIFVVWAAFAACGGGGTTEADGADEDGTAVEDGEPGEGGDGLDEGTAEEADAGEAYCPDGPSCSADFPCWHPATTYHPHCEGNVRLNPRDIPCAEICGTPCCSGGGCEYASEPCEAGTVCRVEGDATVCVGECSVTATFADAATVLDTVWVSAERGDDGTADGSWDNPFATLEAALGAAQPGDDVRLEAGTYAADNWVEGLQGTASNPIHVGGASTVPAEMPVIQGGGEGLHLVDPRYVVLENLIVRGASSNGINIDDGGDYSTPAEYVVLRNVTIEDVGSGGNNDCLKLSGLDRFYVLESDFARCGAIGSEGSGIDMVGCHDGAIVGNTFDTMGANAVQAKGGTARIAIARNLVTNGGARAFNLGGSTDLPYFRPLGADYEARDLWAFSNVIVGGEAAIAFVGCDGCLAANNTILDPGRWVVRILQESVDGFVPCRNGRFVNNLVVYSSAVISTEVNVGPDTSPDTFTFSHNLWFDADAPGSAPDLPVAEDGSVLADPLLVDPDGGNYEPGAGSPALGAGTGVTEVTATFAGGCPGEPPNIGAL